METQGERKRETTNTNLKHCLVALHVADFEAEKIDAVRVGGNRAQKSYEVRKGASGEMVNASKGTSTASVHCSRA